MKKMIIAIGLLASIGVLTNSCKKYLDLKADKKFQVIESLDEMQGLMDYYGYMTDHEPGGGEISCDNIYITDANLYEVEESAARLYRWQAKNVWDDLTNDWINLYTSTRPIYISNTVLASIDKVSRAASPLAWDNVKGQALYYRAKSFLQGVIIFSLAYDATTANQDLGMVLRLTPDFNEASVRATVQETYDQIIGDFQAAIRLLPTSAVHPTRPARGAAYAMLSRTYLSMRKYEEAGLYADSALLISNDLMDFNDGSLIDTTTEFPIPFFNSEVYTNCTLTSLAALGSYKSRIDSALYASFEEDDLRKKVFFIDNHDGSFGFQGSYAKYTNFSGPAVDEMYLTRAECRVRANALEGGLDDLNALLVKRYRTGTFIPISTPSTSEALERILGERRKELLLRGIRWMDIKRLNKEGANIILTRIVNGVTYTLPPNDLRYAIPIPEGVIQLSGGTIVQNPR